MWACVCVVVSTMELTTFHGIAIFLHTISSLTLLGLSTDGSEQPLRFFVTNFTDSHETNTLSVGTFRPELLLVVAGLISGTQHGLCYLYAWRGQQIKWLDYSISSALMIVVLGNLCGMSDPFLLGTVALLQSYLMGVSYVMEMVEPFPTVPFFATVGVYVLGVWTPIFGYFYSDSSVPAFVTIIIVSLFLVYSSFGVLFWLQARDVAYLSASLTAKVLLQWVLYGGTRSRSEDASLVVSLLTGLIVLAGLLFAWLARRYTQSTIK